MSRSGSPARPQPGAGTRNLYRSQHERPHALATVRDGTGAIAGKEQVRLPRNHSRIMMSARINGFSPTMHSRRSRLMKTTARLAALTATLVLVAGCTGLRHKDKPTRDPVQLPGASQPGTWTRNL